MAAPLQGVDGRLVSGFLRHAVLVPFLFLAVTLALFARFPRLGLPVEGRAMTHFDWAPTILESVGARLPEGRLGLGVSLYAKEQTLVERMGIERLNRELTRFSPFYTRLAQGN